MQQSENATQDPELGVPKWFSDKGSWKISYDSNEEFLRLVSGSDSLEIFYHTHGSYKGKWEINIPNIYNLTCSTIELRQVFGVDFAKQNDKKVQDFLNKYKAETGYEPYYVRFQNYLKIGKNIDEGLSVELTDPIKKAVRGLIEKSGAER